MSLTKQVSLHGKRAYLDTDDRLVGRGGLAAGGEGKPAVILPGPDTVAFFEDFLSDLSSLGAGSDTGTTPIAIGVNDTGVAGQYFLSRPGDTGVKGGLAAATNGVYRITSSATIAAAAPATCGRSIVGKQLAWKMDQGPGTAGRLRFGARVKLSAFPSKTSGDWSGIFMGFTDATGAEIPIYDTGRTGDSGASAVSVASDCVGFLWGTGGDTGWRGVAASSGSGGANDSGDQQVTLTTARPTDNVYRTFEVELRRSLSDTGGTALFYIDGQLLGKLNSPVAQATALTPVISFYDTGGAVNCDIDWVNPSAPRDTGA